jgi:hypothetical protein
MPMIALVLEIRKSSISRCPSSELTNQQILQQVLPVNLLTLDEKENPKEGVRVLGLHARHSKNPSELTIWL